MMIFDIPKEKVVYSRKYHLLFITEVDMPYQMLHQGILVNVNQYRIIGKKETIYYKVDEQGRSLDLPNIITAKRSLNDPVTKLRYRPLSMEIIDPHNLANLYLFRLDDPRPIHKFLQDRIDAGFTWE